ncbi:amidase family protein [Sphingomonas sp. R647]|uniref:amidase family protein n=1 Tax=Sphingomonas sp. R647 TaxID=2875233 RepID=UPI00296F8AEF|nr:amidase family protein [Sphingomonas sp. R647]
MTMRIETANEIARLDGHGQAELVRTGQIALDAPVEAAITRIEAVNGPINAIAARAFDHGRAAAARIDPTVPMAGVPYLLKASLEYPGFPCEAGSRAKQGEVATRAFPLVRALDAAGLIPVGMSTMPEFGLNASCEGSLYGPTANPWDLSRSSGGSSSGAAAAVAAGLVPFATASDAGGSIRIPAANCGIVGFKPSRGWNVRARAHNLVDDILCSDGLYGRSMRDTIWAARLLRPADKAVDDASRPGLRIALDLTGLDGAGPSPDVADAVHRAAALCETLGHQVEPAQQPIDRAALRAGFTTLWDYLGGEIVDHYGARATEVLEPWTLGLAERRGTVTPERLAEALAQIDRASRALAAFHASYDVVLSPVTATVATPLGELAPTRPTDALFDALFGFVNYTPLHNMTGAPSISLPLGHNDDGLPVGVMVSADLGGDDLLLALGRELEVAAPWGDRWPSIAFPG